MTSRMRQAERGRRRVREAPILRTIARIPEAMRAQRIGKYGSMKLVGVRGFEPPAPAFRTQYSNQAELHSDMRLYSGTPGKTARSRGRDDQNAVISISPS